MADQRRDVSCQSAIPPYADPRTVLVSIPIHFTVNQVPVAVPSQTGLGKFLPSFLLVFFLLYMIYQIILAGFNCTLESTNLGWIRASFFLNIPFLLTACIYLIRNCVKKKLPSLFSLWLIISLHSAIFINYVLLMGIYFEVDELKKIKGALRNATVTDPLPCSTNYYENVLMLRYFNIVLFF